MKKASSLFGQGFVRYNNSVLRPSEIRGMLKRQPFEPIRIGLSDGRSVLVRHPDQVVVAERHIIIGLAKVSRSRPLATPRTGDEIAKDWMIVNLLNLTTVEPANGQNGKPRKKQ